MDKINQKTTDMNLTQREMKKQNLLVRVKGNSVIMSGTIDDVNPGSYLVPFLDKVHENILEKGIQAIEIDICCLDFINSTGIKDLIYWLLKVDSQDNNKKYSITFLCDRQSRWHSVSVAMIQKIIPERIYMKFV